MTLIIELHEFNEFYPAFGEIEFMLFQLNREK